MANVPQAAGMIEAWGEPDDSPFDAAIEAGWIDPVDQSKALIDVMNERARQWDTEGFSPEHDDAHDKGELALAAACYALTGREWPFDRFVANVWPWPQRWWKPTDRRRDLVKAAALLLAEIERLDRASERAEAPK